MCGHELEGACSGNVLEGFGKYPLKLQAGKDDSRCGCNVLNKALDRLNKATGLTGRRSGTVHSSVEVWTYLMWDTGAARVGATKKVIARTAEDRILIKG